MAQISVGIAANPYKEESAEYLSALQAILQRKGAQVFLERVAADFCGEKGRGEDAHLLADQVDFFIVLGGDGTILSLINRLQGKMKPIAGMNIGNLGFLTFARGSMLEEAVEHLLKGEYVVTTRSLLAATLGKEGKVYYGLNEVALGRATVSRLIQVETFVNEELLGTFHADGLLVATPTGSTAYSLSAGGPVVDPIAEVFVITPICPHVLSNRPVVVSDREIVKIKPLITRNDEEILVTVDGQKAITLGIGEVVELKKAPFALPLIMMPGYSFYTTLREKLNWRGNIITK